MNVELTFVGLALLLLVSVLASKVAARFGVPALLLFLLFGMAMGSEGPGGIAFDDPSLTQTVGVVALAFILFSGGLDTRWYNIQPVLREGLLLSTVGVALTALVVGWFAHVFLGFSWATGILLGSLMSSTDAAAVFSVLRGQGVNLKGKLKPMLELESGSNDPMAVFLTIGFIQLITSPATTPLDLIPLFIFQLVIGGGMGLMMGRFALLAINRLRLEYDGLYPVLSLSFVLLTYGATAVLGGSGFLAVYLAGLVLARSDFIHKNSLNGFHDGLAWLMQIAVFLTLGLQIYPSELVDVAPEGLMVALFMIFAARPFSVLIATLPTRLSLREKLFISWVGLRGATPIILATFPLLAGIITPTPIFELVFFVVLTSVLLQGTTIIRMAKWLNVYNPDPDTDRSMLAAMVAGKNINNFLIEVIIPPGAQAVGKRVLDLNISTTTLIVLISRRDEVIVPNGSTILEAGDHLLVLGDRKEQAAVWDMLCR